MGVNYPKNCSNYILTQMWGRKERDEEQSSSEGIWRFPKVQLNDCVKCEKRIGSGQSWGRLRERVCVRDFFPIFTVVLEVERWKQGIKSLWEVGDIKSKRWIGCGWKKLKNSSELLWILFFFNENLLLTQK